MQQFDHEFVVFIFFFFISDSFVLFISEFCKKINSKFLHIIKKNKLKKNVASV